MVDTFGTDDCLLCLLRDGLLFFCRPLAGNEAKYSFRDESNIYKIKMASGNNNKLLYLINQNY